ncbi:hypothetical protein V2J09_010206 [Rumex salicifolius]
MDEDSLLRNKKMRFERFFKERKDLGFHDPWLYVHAFCKRTERLQWQVLDLTKLSWHTIKPMPDCVNNAGFRCVSIPHEGTLFVIGNMDSVLKYEAQKDQWSIITNKMITPRCHFAAELVNGMLCVAGGYNDQLSELNSAESMDPIKGVWRSIPSMGMSLASYDSAVLDGKFLVTEGWFWPFFVSPRGQVYDPEKESWETMAVGLREGWTGSSVMVYDHLFVVTEHERMKLKVYDQDSDSWETIDGPPLPDQICKPFCVSSCDSRIFVVGRGLHVAVGYVCRVDQRGCSDRKNWRFSVSWRVVHAPDELSELTPSSSQM